MIENEGYMQPDEKYTRGVLVFGDFHSKLTML
jgi:hypothetical protein